MNRSSWSVCAALLALVSGCKSSAPRAAQESMLGPLEVDVSGASKDSAISEDALVARVHEQIGSGADKLAARTVRVHADVAQWALLSKQAEPSAALVPTGELLDRVAGVSNADDSWESLLHARLSDRRRFADFDRARARVLDLLREGRIDDACAAFPLTTGNGTASHAILAIEAARLEGVALLLDERFDDAERAFQRGADAGASRPLDRANMLLMQCGAASNAGKAEAARVAWRDAVTLGATLATGTRRVCDPPFWLRALNLKDSDEPWPADAIARIADDCQRELGVEIPTASRSACAEALVWTLIGTQRLSRTEWNGALVAFTRAEAATANEPLRPRLRLAQAKALAQLADPSAARALLTTLAADPTPAVAHAARALLGALELQLGRTALGLALLQQAVDAEPPVDWPGRGGAEANLGLAHLMSGDADEGLRRLHAAQTRFQNDDAVDDLNQCLRNELQFLESAGRREEAQIVRARLTSARLE